MRWLGLLALAGALGCNIQERQWYQSIDEEQPPDIPPLDLACDICVGTAPATYTGPSTFWLGRIDDANPPPDCPSRTPLLGIEGQLQNPTPWQQYARECLVTPSDACEAEGQVCVPAPNADYHTCIHHTGEADCPPEYHQRYRMTEGKADLDITLCCRESPISG